MKNIYWFISHLLRKPPFRTFVSSRLYLKITYKAYVGKSLNLENPKTFNEKIQWLKLNDQNPDYVNLSDKHLVRDFVEKTIGSQYLIPQLGVWKKFEDIDFDKLPNQFVLKCNHDSGSVVICKDKSTLDKKKIKKFLNKRLAQNYYWSGREDNYRNIRPRIIAEMLLKSECEDILDYKIFCFDGKPRFVQVDVGRFSNHCRNFYDLNWDFIDVQYGCKNDKKRGSAKPLNFSEMLTLAEKLSKNIPHVRVDFYEVGGKIYFGEMTFHHGSGLMKICPDMYDYLWGDFLKLPQR